jgi:AraC-like DNA-binding protein
MIAGVILRSDVSGLIALGLDPDPVLEMMGLSRAELERLPARVPFDLTERFWHATRAIYPNEGLSVRIPQQSQAENYDVIGYLCRSSANLRGALGYLNRFTGLLLGGYNQLSLTESNGVATLTIESPHAVERQSIEAFICTLGFVARHLTAQTLQPLEVRLQHRRPRDSDTFELHWGRNLVYEAKQYQIVIPVSYLELPLLKHDPKLLQILERQAQEVISSLDETGGFAQSIKKAIARELPHGNPGAPSIARALGVSARTLARRLEEVGVSFRAVQDEVRHELACRYLRATELGIGEIAFMLGFADASSFNRAFKRWSGSSASAYRTARAEADK